MRSRRWRWARPIGGAALLGLVAWRLGTGPIVDGLRAVDARAVAAAVAITGLTTVCSAWRWSTVARGLGLAVPVPAATAAYYRSQFLNTVLPGGVLGDVHRGLRHGRDVDDVGRALRVVGWERLAGQVVQAVLALTVLVAFASPLRPSVAVGLPLIGLAALALLVLVRIVLTRRRRWARLLRREAHAGMLARTQWPAVTLASTVVVAGHAAVFLIATRTAGTDAPLATVLPVAMLVLLAMSVPANVAGWGPREGAAALAFGAAGLGSAAGVAAATVYGVLVFLAGAPGLVVLILARQRRPAPAPALRRRSSPADRMPMRRTDGVAHV